jgi:hypothetical protein
MFRTLTGRKAQLVVILLILLMTVCISVGVTAYVARQVTLEIVSCRSKAPGILTVTYKLRHGLGRGQLRYLTCDESGRQQESGVAAWMIPLAGWVLDHSANSLIIGERTCNTMGCARSEFCVEVGVVIVMDRGHPVTLVRCSDGRSMSIVVD